MALMSNAPQRETGETLSHVLCKRVFVPDAPGSSLALSGPLSSHPCNVHNSSPPPRLCTRFCLGDIGCSTELVRLPLGRCLRFWLADGCHPLSTATPVLAEVSSLNGAGSSCSEKPWVGAGSVGTRFLEMQARVCLGVAPSGAGVRTVTAARVETGFVCLS